MELSFVVDTPFGRLREVAEALGGAAGETAERLGLDLGLVGIVDGEEPVLTTMRPRRGDVAERLVRELLAGESHRRPTLWLALRRGAYLAEAVDPWQPFRLTPGRAPGPLERASVVDAGVLVIRRDSPASCRLELTCYGPTPLLRRILIDARRQLGGFVEG